MSLYITSIPGVHVLPFWQAKYYSRNVIREIRAVVWHFAEGGGTDTWLLHPSNDNSSHFVVKYNGDVRQMVRLTDASHSLHVSYDADTNDAPDFGIFSLSAAKAALGAGLADPNRYIIAVEVEGYQAKGYNEAQAGTIKALARELERRFPKAVHLGHRDFQDYKPCPGPSIFRGLLPHVGRLGQQTGAEPMGLPFKMVSAWSGDVTIQAGRGLVNPIAETHTVPAETARTFRAYGRASLDEPYMGGGTDRRLGYLVNVRDSNNVAGVHIMLDATVEVAVPDPVDPADCSEIEEERDQALTSLAVRQQALDDIQNIIDNTNG